ncbi:MAG: hypothetical protein WBA87_01985 [Microbacterium sp.]
MMKKIHPGTSVLLTAALALAAGIGTAAPAMADTMTPPPVSTPCPDRAPTTFGELDYTSQHGTSVDEYYSGNGTAMQVFSLDGIYEVFGTNGQSVGRICYEKKPPRLDNIKPAEQQFVSNGGGGSSVGHYVHGVNIRLLTTTKWVKWTVRVG